MTDFEARAFQSTALARHHDHRALVQHEDTAEREAELSRLLAEDEQRKPDEQ